MVASAKKIIAIFSLTLLLIPASNIFAFSNEQSETLVGLALHTTKTAVSPNPSSVIIGKTITFTGKVTDTNSTSKTVPTGTISWNDGGAGGAFTVGGVLGTTCNLSSISSSASSCKVTYTPPATATVGTVITIHATYSGDSTHSISSGKSTLTVVRATSTKITPSTASVADGASQLYTATVADTTSSGTKTAPTGTVSWKASVTGGSFNSISCVLAPISSSQGSCQVTYTSPTTAGTVTVTGSYGGDSIHAKSAGMATLTVTCLFHVNGLGQFYTDCSALGTPGNQATYTASMAAEAATAWGHGAPTSGTCGTENAYFVQTVNSAAVWVYSGSAAGYVHLNPTSSPFCPVAGVDPAWN